MDYYVEIVLLRANPLGFAGGRQQTILKVNGNDNEGRLALRKGNSKQKGASALGKVKHMKKFVTLLTALLLVATAGTAYAGGGAVGSQGNPGITPPQAKPHGLTYGEWSAVWWEWSFSLPLSQNPMFMDGNVDLSLHQPDGPVWFLGGTFVATPDEHGGYIGKADRRGIIPTGKALFFPVLNCEYDNQTFVPPEDMTIPELYAFAHASLDSNQSMDCEINGVSVKNLWNPDTGISPYRTVSPVFSYWLPATDNMQQSWRIDVSGWIGHAVADGVS